MFAEDLGGDTVSSRTFPLGSVNSKAGLLTSWASSSDPMPMEGSCRHEYGVGSSTIWEPRPCEVTALFPDETDQCFVLSRDGVIVDELVQRCLQPHGIAEVVEKIGFLESRQRIEKDGCVRH